MEVDIVLYCRTIKTVIFTDNNRISTIIDSKKIHMIDISLCFDAENRLLVLYVLTNEHTLETLNCQL